LLGELARLLDVRIGLPLLRGLLGLLLLRLTLLDRRAAHLLGQLHEVLRRQAEALSERHRVDAVVAASEVTNAVGFDSSRFSALAR
jgi:hypothetical protein